MLDQFGLSRTNQFGPNKLQEFMGPLGSEGDNRKNEEQKGERGEGQGQREAEEEEMSTTQLKICKVLNKMSIYL